MMNKLYMGILLIILTLIFTGCSDSKSMKEEISIAVNTPPSTVDPQLMSDVPSAIVGSFGNVGLYEYDNEGNLKPCLAESHEVSDDGCTYTFHLKKGLKWSDGRPLTAEDFVFAFRRLSDPDVGSNSIYLITDNSMILNAKKVNSGELPVSELGVSAPDKDTFVVVLEEPCPYFCSLVSKQDFSPCNEDFYHEMGNSFASSGDTLLYSGPYIMDQYEPLPQQIHFTKNPYYVDADTITVPGITLRVVENTQQAMMCYEAGDIDIAKISGELAELALGDPELQVFPQANIAYIAFNSMDCPALKNRNIRMAISKSLDRKNITDKVIKTGATPLTRINPPKFYRETDGTDFSYDNFQYDEYSAYDSEEAKKLMEKGLSELGVSKITLNIIYHSVGGSTAEAMADQMKSSLPGLEINLTPLPFKEVLQRKARNDYDLLYITWIADYVDPTSFLGIFTESSANGYSNPEYEELFSRIQSAEFAGKPDERNKLMHEAEDFLMEDAALIPLWMNNSNFLINSGVKGFALTPTGDAYVVTGLTKEVQ